MDEDKKISVAIGKTQELDVEVGGQEYHLTVYGMSGPWYTKFWREFQKEYEKLEKKKKADKLTTDEQLELSSAITDSDSDMAIQIMSLCVRTEPVIKHSERLEWIYELPPNVRYEVWIAVLAATNPEAITANFTKAAGVLEALGDIGKKNNQT